MVNFSIKGEVGSGSTLSDKRLKSRLVKMLESFSKQPSGSIYGSSECWKDALGAYRFLNNENVSASSILSGHKSQTLRRLDQSPVLLIIQDTTQIDYSHLSAVKDLGTTTGQGRKGCFLHTQLACTPDRLCYGVLESDIWTRDSTQGLGIKKRPIVEKESYRWLRGYEVAEAVAQRYPNSQVVSVSDREGDIYELFVKAEQSLTGALWLIRARHDRKVDAQAHLPASRLKAALQQEPCLLEIDFEVDKLPQRHGRTHLQVKPSRSKRRVRQALRAKRFRICPPKQGSGEVRLPAVEFNAISCTEITPPDGESPIEWILITNAPIKTKTQIKAVVQWYCARWQIEIFFKVLKSGCKVENAQLKSFSAIANYIAVCQIVAWRILFLSAIGRTAPQLECDIVFSEAEWKGVWISIKQAPLPRDPPSVGEIMQLVSQAGGFKGRKNDGYPGVVTMWEGMRKVACYAQTWLALQKI